MQQNDTPDVNPAISAWDAQLRDDGIVVFGHATWAVALLVGMGVMIVGVIGYGVASVGVENLDRLTVFISAVFVAFPLFWYLVWLRRAPLVVEAEGVRVMNFTLVPWQDLVSADVWTRSNYSTVVLTVSHTFMDKHRSRQWVGARALLVLSAYTVGPDRISLPQSTGPSPQDLADWLNALIARHVRSIQDVRGERRRNQEPVWYDTVLRR